MNVFLHQEHKCATKDLLLRTLSEIVVKADGGAGCSAAAVVRRLRETTFKGPYLNDVLKCSDFGVPMFTFVPPLQLA